MIRTYLILFIGLFSVVAGSLKVKACGPRKPDPANFEMIDPLVFPDSTYRPFYYDPRQPYYDQSDALFSQIAVEQNLEQWKAFVKRRKEDYFGWAYGRPSVKKAIYKYDIQQLKNEKESRFGQFLDKNPDVLDYLVFAKQCEKAISGGNPWSDQKRSIKAVQNLIPKAEKGYRSATDDFLRFRYAYQLMLLARYGNQHGKAIEVFNKSIKPLKNHGPLYYWALHHKAFCHLQKQQPIRANLASAKVFANAPAKRLRAFLYFDNGMVEATIDRNNLPAEKAARLRAMKNMMNPGPAIEPMRTIYRADPKNKTLRFLLVRELNKWETNIYTKKHKKLEIPIRHTIEKQLSKDKAYLSSLIDFTAQVIKENQVKDPDFWQLIRGHALMINGQYRKALQQLRYVNKGQLTNPNQKVQLEKSRLIAKTYTSKVDQAFDDYIYHKLTWFKTQKDVVNNFKSQIGHLALFIGKYYEQNGQLPKAVLFYNYAIMKGGLTDIEHQYAVESGYPSHPAIRYPYYFYYLDNYATAWQVQEFLDLLQKARPSNLEAMLLKPLHYSLNRIRDLKATLHFRQDELQQCKRTLQTIPDSFFMREDMPYKEYLYYNPFVRNYGYYLGAFRVFGEKDSIRYTKPEMVTQLLQYKQKAQAGKRPAYHYFKVGNAYANFSFGGKAWLMYVYLKSYNYAYEPMKDKPFFQYVRTLKKAEHYYRKAYRAANDKTTKAFLARVIMDAQLHRVHYADYNGKPGYTKAPIYDVLKSNYPEEVETLVKDPHSYHTYLKAAFK